MWHSPHHHSAQEGTVPLGERRYGSSGEARVGATAGTPLTLSSQVAAQCEGGETRANRQEAANSAQSHANTANTADSGGHSTPITGTSTTVRTRETTKKLRWADKMLKIFEPLDFKDAKPKRPQQRYTVKPGDTIAGIALRHGMKEAEVRAMNNLWEGNVFAGQEIILHRKKRSQSMPELAGAMGSVNALQQGQANTKETEGRKRVEFTNQTEEEPVEEEEALATFPLKARSRSSHTLDAIMEQQPHTGFFGSLFGGTFTKKAEEPQKKVVTSSTRAPRLKTRSYSERLPTNQEEQDDVYGLPKLIGAVDSDILSDARHGPKLVPKIEAFLPMRLRGYDWKLLYSLAQHGSSLHSLTQKVRGQRATLIVVETCKGEVFGGFVSAAWANSLSYYGSGESFVFTTVPAFEVFNWKRTNSMFMYSNDDSIAMGGGGSFAWHLNSDLSRGTSGVSETFGNRCLTTDPDFDIVNVEVWGFAMF